jgi:hypothetical protein
MLMLQVTHETRLWMAQRPVHFWYGDGAALALRHLPCVRSVFWQFISGSTPAWVLALRLRDGLGGGFGLVTLAQGVRGAGAGLEVDGFLQQARDAFHLELDCGGGDAPLVSAAHGAIRSCGSVEDDATWDALLMWFARAASVLLLGRDHCAFGIDGTND